MSWRVPALSLAMAALALAACGPAGKSAPSSSPVATAADIVPAPAAPPAPPPPPPAPDGADYGVLGSPWEDTLKWSEADADFDDQSPREKLDLFRYNEAHPGNGTIEHPVIWTQIEEREALQRALFYAVLKTQPGLITARDRKRLAADEQDLIRVACLNRGDAGVLFYVAPKDCPPKDSHPADQ